MSRLLTFLGATTQPLASLSNHTNVPGDLKSQVNTSPNELGRVQCRTAKGGMWRDIQALFGNMIFGQNTEAQGDYDFNLWVALEYPLGTWTDVKFGGNANVALSRAYGMAWCDIVRDASGRKISIPENTDYAWWCYKEATSASAGAGTSIPAGNYKHCRTVSTSSMRQDGTIPYASSGNSASVRGTGIPRGAKCLPIDPTKIIGGAIAANSTTAILKDTTNLGSNYTAGLTLGFFYGVAGQGSAAAKSPGGGLSGYGTPAGGALSYVTVNAGSSGLDASKLPIPYVAGSNNSGNGFGSDSTAYGPMIVLARPSKPIKTVHIFGDSYMDGGVSEFDACYGYLESILFKRGFATFKTAVNGESAAGWLANNTRWNAILQSAKNKGLRVDWVYQGMLINDAQLTAYTKANFQTFATNVNNALKNIWGTACKVALPTLPPSTLTNASSSKYSTLAEQTGGTNSNYASGGSVELYNADLLARIAPTCDATVNTGGLVRDAATTWKWRVDTYGGAVALTYDEGGAKSVHLNSTGQQYVIDNLDMSGIR